MNLMRKIVTQSSKLLGDAGSPSCQDHSLSLMHLKKLFLEVNKPGATAKDIENNIYNMLPLFCKVVPLGFYLRSRKIYSRYSTSSMID